MCVCVLFKILPKAPRERPGCLCFWGNGASGIRLGEQTRLGGQVDLCLLFFVQQAPLLNCQALVEIITLAWWFQCKKMKPQANKALWVGIFIQASSIRVCCRSGSAYLRAIGLQPVIPESNPALSQAWHRPSGCQFRSKSIWVCVLVFFSTKCSWLSMLRL